MTMTNDDARQGRVNFEIVDMDRRWLDAARDIYQWYVKNSTATFQIRLRHRDAL